MTAQQALKLVAGFVHNEDKLISLNDYNNIIPTNITQLIYQYYTTAFTVFINNCNTYSDVIAYHALDITFADNFQLNTNIITSELLDNLSPYCYVPNILNSSSIKSVLTSKLNHQQKNEHIAYDAIFTFKSYMLDWEEEFVACLFLFNNNTSNQSESHVLQSNINIAMKSFIYCDKYGIVCESDDYTLYQLDLHTIVDTNFKFKPLISENIGVKIWQDEFDNKFGFESKLKMLYLTTDESIFAIKTRKPWNVSWYTKEVGLKVGCSVKCNMYDLKKHQWIKIPEYQYNAYSSDKNNFQCSLFHQISSNALYLTSNLGHTSQYDFIKNTWIDLCIDIDNEDMIFPSEPVIWSYDYAPNIIYCLGNKPDPFDFRQSINIKCSCLDIRDSKPNWIKCMSSIEEECKQKLQGQISLLSSL